MYSKLFCAFAACALAHASYANEAISISAQAEYRDPDRVAPNIKKECDLPGYQSKVIQQALTQNGYTVTTAEGTDIPAQGKYLKLQIVDALSAGHAFVAHHKSIGIVAILYKNGKEVAKQNFVRNSMGGAFAGFKGSCTVLQRCADTISQDVKEWLRSADSNAPAASAAPTDKAEGTKQ